MANTTSDRASDTQGTTAQMVRKATVGSIWNEFFAPPISFQFVVDLLTESLV